MALAPAFPPVRFEEWRVGVLRQAVATDLVELFRDRVSQLLRVIEELVDGLARVQVRRDLLLFVWHWDTRTIPKRHGRFGCASENTVSTGRVPPFRLRTAIGLRSP